MSEEKLVFRIALHARNEQEAKRLLATIVGLFDEEQYFVTTISPKPNKNLNVALGAFALLTVYEKDVIE